MRKLIYAINISLDGCCDHTKMTPTDDMMAHYTKLVQDKVFIYGRKTYELMVPFWPDAANDPASDAGDKAYADMFVAAEKVVFSRTLKSVEAQNSRLVTTDLKEEILRLKQQAGNDLLTGGVELPAQLIAMGLVDEFHIVVHPLMVGEGRRLLDEAILTAKVGLKLIKSETFESGCVALTYAKQ